MPLLEVSIENVGYGRVTVLRELTLVIDEGEFIAVLGPNAAGKTTLLRTISGILVRTRGEIRFDGADITSLPAHRRARAGIIHVPEGRRVYTGLTVAENLAMGGLAVGKGSPTHSELQRIYELFPVLAERANQQATSLSGGEQQMLAIGRGLLAEPRLLMVDEASLGLAPALTREVFVSLSHIREQGTAILMVEQNARAALMVADRAYVLERGSIALSGSATELISDERMASLYLGGGRGDAKQL